MKNKTALENAGFVDGVLKTKDFRIQVDDWDNDVFEVTINTTGGKCVGFPNPVNGLEELSKVCFGFLGYDLDFTAKPKYDWETVFDKFPVYNHNKVINTEIAINVLAKEGIISKLEALSMVAKLKLNIIIQQIDKDYPKDKNKGFGYISYTSDKIMYSDSCVLKNALDINTESPEGAEILLDQNPQLLQNLFKIETDATGED